MTRHAVASLVLLSIFSACASAQDWPGWRGAGRDGKLPGFPSPAAWPKELERGWSIEVGGGHSTPALVEGRLYVHARQGEDEAVLCLEAATGKELWRERYAAPYTPDPVAITHGKGPFSSPTVADGRLFTFGVSGILSCLDARTGRVLWRQDFKDRFPATYPEWGTAMSPLLFDGTCIVHAGGKDKGAIIAFETATGKPRWSWEGDGPAYTSPVIGTFGGTPQLVTQTQGKTVGLDPKHGKLLWEFEYKTSYEQNSVTPVIFGDLVVFSGYQKGTTAYRLGGKQPEQAWHTDEVSMYMSSPVLKGERLFGFSEKKRGQFFCLDAANGKVLWLGDGRQGENGAILDAGEVILALTTPAAGKPGASRLIVFDASDKAYAERARYTIAETPTWAHPVVSGRSLFIKDEKTLTRWTIP